MLASLLQSQGLVKRSAGGLVSPARLCLVLDRGGTMRSTDAISIFSDHYPQAEFPSSFLDYLQTQEATDHPIRRAKTGQRLTEFLEGLGVAPEVLAGLFDSESKVIRQADFADLLDSSASEIQTYLAHHWSTVFDLQEVVLDSETLTGFNRHGREHLQSVTRRMHQLLRHPAVAVPPVDSHLEKEATIAGYVHDVGNLVSRKEHGIYGLYLLTQLFTNFDRDQETLSSFQRVMEAVLFHEVEYGSRLASLERLSPVTLALIVADKTDVSFRRVSDKSNASEAIRDAHMLVNLLTADSRVRCRKRGFEWEVHFSPTMADSGAGRFPALLKRAERVWVPDDWQKLYRRENIEYVFIFHATFLRLYWSRLSFAVRAIFALNPAVESFRLIINDDERGVSLSRTFYRPDFEAKLGLIYNNLFKNQPDEVKG